MPYIYKNVSIEDFDRRFDKIESITEKFKFMYAYILSHGLNKNVDFSLEVLIHHARNKFIQAVINSKKEFKPIDKKEEEEDINVFDAKKSPNFDVLEKKFIKNPVNFIKRIAEIATNPNLSRNDIGDIVVEDDGDEEYYDLEKWKNNCGSIANYLKAIEEYYGSYNKDFLVDDINKKIFKCYYDDENKTKDDILNDTKGGFFENLFGTTSDEFKNLRSTYLEFNNKESSGYADKDNLEAATRAYLQHKIPSYKLEDDLPKEEDVAKLSGTAKKRVAFCIGILEAINESKQIEQFVQAIKTGNVINEQEKFQENLTNILEENRYLNKNENVIDENIITNDNKVSM